MPDAKSMLEKRRAQNRLGDKSCAISRAYYIRGWTICNCFAGFAILFSSVLLGTSTNTRNVSNIRNSISVWPTWELGSNKLIRLSLPTIYASRIALSIRSREKEKSTLVLVRYANLRKSKNIFLQKFVTEVKMFFSEFL